MIVFCDDRTCRFNDGTGCTAKSIEITISTGIREDGSNGAVNICKQYRSREDGMSDV